MVRSVKGNFLIHSSLTSTLTSKYGKLSDLKRNVEISYVYLCKAAEDDNFIIRENLPKDSYDMAMKFNSSTSKRRAA
jgi:hypothetical protein